MKNYFKKIINPTPGLTLDDQINVDEQFSYRDDPNQDYTLPSPLKTRLDNILQEAREKINSIAFPSPAIEEIIFIGLVKLRQTIFILTIV